MTTNQTIFKTVFGDKWSRLPSVFHKHYANRAGQCDRVVVKGTMNVWQHPILRPFGFLLRLTKTLVPITGDNLPATVTFVTRSNSNSFWYERSVENADGKFYHFVSELEHLQDNQVVEWTGLGVGWHSRFDFVDGLIVLDHVGYRMKIGHFNFPLPISWIIGKPSAWEEAINDNRFRMEMVIEHFLLGKLYSYTGLFDLSEMKLAK